MPHGNYAECPQCGVVAHEMMRSKRFSDLDTEEQNRSRGVELVEVVVGKG